MAINDWLWQFVAEHQDRHPRADWPDTDANPGYYDGWRANFVRAGLLDLAVATEASVRLMADAPRNLTDHVPAILKAAKAIYRERAESGQGDPCATRDAAVLAAKDCPDCHAQGLAVRWLHDEPGQPSVRMYCTCAMGRWVERTHRDKTPDIRKRIPDMEECPTMQLMPVAWSDAPDNRFRYPGDLWDGFNDRPVAVEMEKLKAVVAADRATAKRPERRDRWTTSVFRPENLPPSVRRVLDRPLRVPVYGTSDMPPSVRDAVDWLEGYLFDREVNIDNLIVDAMDSGHSEADVRAAGDSGKIVRRVNGLDEFWGWKK